MDPIGQVISGLWCNGLWSKLQFFLNPPERERENKNNCAVVEYNALVQTKNTHAVHVTLHFPHTNFPC